MTEYRVDQASGLSIIQLWEANVEEQPESLLLWSEVPDLMLDAGNKEEMPEDTAKKKRYPGDKEIGGERSSSGQIKENIFHQYRCTH